MSEGAATTAVYLPYSTAARLGGSRVSSYVVTMVDENRMAQSKGALERALTGFSAATTTTPSSPCLNWWTP